LRLLRENATNTSASQYECSDEAVATMIGCLPTQALAFLAVFVYATHATQAIAFEWKPGLTLTVDVGVYDTRCDRVS